MTNPTTRYDAVTHREIPANTPRFIYHRRITVQPSRMSEDHTAAFFSLQGRASVIPNDDGIEVEQEWLDLSAGQSTAPENKVLLQQQIRACGVFSRDGLLNLQNNFVSFPRALYLVNPTRLVIHPKTLILLLQSIPMDAPLLLSVQRLTLSQDTVTDTRYEISDLERFKNLQILRLHSCEVALQIDIAKMDKLKELICHDFSYTNHVPEERMQSQLSARKIVSTFYTEAQTFGEVLITGLRLIHSVVDFNSFSTLVFTPANLRDIKNAAE